MPGATQDVVDIRADAGDVADLPAGHDGLAVEVDAGRAVASEHVLERAGEVRLGAADADLAWAPVPGYHRLELRDARAVLDSVRFTVRPAR